MQFDAQLPEGWRWETIESVQSAEARPVVTGPFGSSIGSKFFVDAGVPVIRGSNLSLSRTKFIDEGFVFLTEEKAAEFKNLEAHPGDLVFTAAGTIGQVGIIPASPRFPHYIISNKQMRARLDTSIVEPLFAYYWFSEPYVQEYVRSRNTGSTIPLINLSVLRSLPIPVPPIDTQKGILGVLTALDDRIELLRQTNATLESVAQALFKSWFIDFDPVRAKAEGREPEGMDVATAALFPSEFEDSALGLMPKGWHESTLAEHISAERGLSYKGAGLCTQGDGLPMHNLNSVLEGGGYKYAGIKHYSGDFKDRHLAVAGDVIVANTEQGHDHRLIGFPAIVPARYETAIYSHHLYRLRLKRESTLTTHSLYYMLMTPDVREQIIGCANGSTVNMLKVAGLEIPRFVCPPKKVPQAFQAVVEPLWRQIEANVERSGSLTQLRDTLLPRLISGKLRLAEAVADIQAMA